MFECLFTLKTPKITNMSSKIFVSRWISVFVAVCWLFGGHELI